MKTILFILLVALSLPVQAQEGKGQQHRKGQHHQNDYSPEQQADLKTKRMALHLDLNEQQQKKLLEVNLSWAEKRTQSKEKWKAQKESAEKLDSDQKYALQSQMLDDQMNYQNEVKKILTEDQYAIWKKHRSERMGQRRKGKRHSHGGKQQRDRS
jgi:hypothetical protein